MPCREQVDEAASRSTSMGLASRKGSLSTDKIPPKHFHRELVELSTLSDGSTTWTVV